MVINYYYSSFNYPIQTKLSQIKDTHGLKKNIFLLQNGEPVKIKMRRKYMHQLIIS